jgi:hypothetical protein
MLEQEQVVRDTASKHVRTSRLPRKESLRERVLILTVYRYRSRYVHPQVAERPVP